MSDGQRNMDPRDGSETVYRAESPGASGDESTGAAPLDPSLLDEVLNQTMSGREPLSDAELQRLRDVVRRHGGQTFEIDPVGRALVAAVLQMRLPTFDGTDARWQEMTQQIAQAFFDSPEARNRMEQLWNRLCESR